MFSKVKGTQDLLDTALLKGVLAKVHAFLAVHNFSEIATPLLEYAALFERSLGNETDVVSKQMFYIAPHKEESEKDRLCLRPEATAGIMRAYLENQHELSNPWKVYTVGPMFRYERPQKGRFRQLHQISLEAIGVASLEYDALFISMLSHLFEEILGLSTFVIHINYLGSAQDREKYKKALREFLDGKDICATCQHRKETNVLRALDCKVETCKKIYENAPEITSYFSEETEKEWQDLQNNLQMLSVTFVHNPFLVRGLDYYNKTVFEFVGTALGAQNALCGGGRYDGLSQELGSKEMVPSIGVGIGIERLLLLCQEHADALSAKKPALHVIIPFDQAQHSLSLLLASTLTKHGICTDVLLEGSSIKTKMKKANKQGASYALLIGQDEMEKNYVTIKNMITGAEEKIEQGKLVHYLKSH